MEENIAEKLPLAGAFCEEARNPLKLVDEKSLYGHTSDQAWLKWMQVLKDGTITAWKFTNYN